MKHFHRSRAYSKIIRSSPLLADAYDSASNDNHYNFHYGIIILSTSVNGYV
jgi:hypothetical protein